MNPIAAIKLSNGQVISVELFPEFAPNTVNNFIELSQNGYFDGLGFVRVVNDRLIQQGDPNMPGPDRTDLTPGYLIDGEFNKDGYSNPLSFTEGTMGMAMAAYEWSPNASAGSFFIMTKDEPTLDSIVPAFGRVVEGMAEVKRINQLKTHNEFGYDAPYEMILIKEIHIKLNGHTIEQVVKIISQ